MLDVSSAQASLHYHFRPALTEIGTTGHAAD